MTRSQILIPSSSSIHLSASFRPGLIVLKRGGVLSHLSFILLTAALSLLPVPGNGARHRCYVCLPDDKSTSIAKEIQALFPQQTIPDCSNFPNSTDDTIGQEFQFDCPNEYAGCSLRYGRYPGIPESRTCTPRHARNCYSVNNIVLCYCAQPLCNRDRNTAQAQGPEHPPEREPIRTSRYFSEVVTDDEDLFPTLGGPRPSHHRQLATEGQVTHPSRVSHEAEDPEGSGGGDFDDDTEYDEEDEDSDHLIIPPGTTPTLNVTHNGSHDPTLHNSTHDNQNHTYHHILPDDHVEDAEEEEPHHSNNDPTYPHHHNDTWEGDVSNDNVDNSQSIEDDETEGDAPTLLQNGSDGDSRRLCNTLLFISPLVVHLVTRKS